MRRGVKKRRSGLGSVRRAGGMVAVWLLLIVTGCSRVVTPDDLTVPDGAVARIVVFQAEDCGHCEEILTDIIDPLKSRCGDALMLKLVDIDEASGYEAFVATEEALIGEAGRWEVPTVVVGDKYLTGVSAVEQELLPYLDCVYGAGGNAWPSVDALEGIEAEQTEEVTDSPFGPGVAEVEPCVTGTESVVCESPDPIFALYLTESECDDTCDRTRYDLRYLQGVYPQLFFEERDMADNLELAEALGKRLGVSPEMIGITPAVVVGEHYLAGDDLTLDSLRAAIGAYSDIGATALWYALDLSD
ncbi:MAG: hypothetical protein ACP5HG_09975 [Anaerolineae bacterium]